MSVESTLDEAVQVQNSLVERKRLRQLATVFGVQITQGAERGKKKGGLTSLTW